MLCVAQFVVVLDATAVTGALPALGRDLGFTAGGLQWVVTAYTLTFGGFLIVGGRVADLVGSRRAFAVGLVWASRRLRSAAGWRPRLKC